MSLKHKILIPLIIIAVIVIAKGLFIYAKKLLNTCSTSAQNAKCSCNVKTFSDIIKQFQDKNGRLPKDRSELFSYMTKEGGLPEHFVCLFNEKGENSYIYIGPDRTVTDNEGKRVILYCSAAHPVEVVSADGDRGKGYYSVIRPDGSIDKIPADKFQIHIVSKENDVP